MKDVSKHAQTALAVLRIVTALLFIEHGTMKLFSFPSDGVAGTEGLVGLSPFMLTAGLLEVIGGLAVLVGVLTRPVAILLSGQMAVAYWMIHLPGNSIFPVLNGGDAAILFCFVFLYLALAGPGAWSLDAKIKLI
ncbi:DoxX family protein (plasmid) [Rhizobium sp. CB3171]|uniref:DoxX family protein n=1 Tax=Rhizobium sp. CB3171 TaxID=3039157 RepID=UPI0024B0F4B9|nr:DoxX family protein [Rhizobium sp. CB3171]WFU06821.1 DoxX family protein [Rhizobium sp. CB3171]